MKIKLLIAFVSLSALSILIGCKLGKNDPRILKSKNIPENVTHVLSLPINGLREYESSSSRVGLVIVLPENFVSVVPIAQAFQSTMLEFIPNIDKSVDEWSEIITINQYVGQSVSASAFADLLEITLRESVEPGYFFDRKSKNHSTYSESSLFMISAYKGRKEIVFASYYSGPLDFAGFRYTIVLSDTMTEEMAQQKIKSFITNNTHIDNF